MKDTTNTKNYLGIVMAVMIVLLAGALLYIADELTKTRKELITTVENMDKILCSPNPGPNYVNTFNYTCGGEIATWVRLPPEKPQQTVTPLTNRGAYRIGGDTA